MASHPAPGERLRTLWGRLSGLPGGRRLFALALGRMVPYTGRLGATVLELEPGRCLAELKDRRRVRNHLGSVHAVALANLGEMTTGLAVLGAMPATVRGILIRLEIDYTKKARGTLVALAECTVPEVEETVDHTVEAAIRDEGGDVVATVTAHWRLGPVPEGNR